MKKLHTRARKHDKRIVLPEGEDPRTIQAVGTILAERIARPVLLGREEAIRSTVA